MTEPETPRQAAKAEGARQAVMIAAMIIAIPVMAWLERKATSPDALRELRMAALKRAERGAAQAAAWCWARAEQARAAYETERA